MSRISLLVFVVLALFGTLAPQAACAHHTFVVKYDGSKTVRVAGVITSVEYSNPHMSFTVDSGGKSWTVETESPAAAKAKGLSQSLLKTGAKVTVTGWPARDGSANMGLNSISFAGGATLSLRGTAR
jgi:Family of unknown function (DUF6152)